MNLRYRRSGTLFIPQYETNNGWRDFVVGDISNCDDLINLCNSIGDLQAPNKWGVGQWYFKPDKSQKKEHMSIIFTKEMYVMGFLGAAKSYFDTTPVDFKI